MKLITGSLSNYNLNIKAADRKWVATVYYDFNNTSYSINSNNIKSFDISDYVTDGKNITMGCVSTSKITLNLVKATATVASRLTNGTTFSIRLRLNNSWMLKSETFVIDKNTRVRRNDGSYDCSITAFDKSFLMTRPFTADGTGIAAVDAVTSIATKYGLTVDPSVNEVVTALGVASPLPVMQDYTDKQVLGFIAGCYGCNARINEDDAICFEWFTSSDDEIGPDRIYSDGCFVSEMEQRTIALIESGTNDDPLVAPNNAAGYSINFENPMMSIEHINAVYNQKIANNAISYRIGKVRYKGNPLNRPGTILTIRDIDGETALFYIMKRSIHYDGGLSETIECLGEGDTALSYKPTSPLQQNVERAMSRMEEAIANATDIITQTRGSIYELIPVDENDSSQGVSGWRLFSTDPTRRNAIVANSSGIGFSSNGGQSFNAAAVYIDEDGQGHINADFINVGTIGADRIGAGAITASKLASEAITADKLAAGAVTMKQLDVGLGVRTNILYNNNFFYGTDGWYTDKANSFSVYDAGTNYACAVLTPDSRRDVSIYQRVWLEANHRYSIFAYLEIEDWDTYNSESKIDVYLDGIAIGANQQLNVSTAVQNEGAVVIKISFDTGSIEGFTSSFTTVGLNFKKLLHGLSACPIVIHWMALSYACESLGFYCSKASWLNDTDYKMPNFIGTFDSLTQLRAYSGEVSDGDSAFVVEISFYSDTTRYKLYKRNDTGWVYVETRDSDTVIDDYLEAPRLSIDEDGNLVTLGRIESDRGVSGPFSYSNDKFSLNATCYQTKDNLDYLYESRLSFVRPPYFYDDGEDGFTPTEGNPVEESCKRLARIELTSLDTQSAYRREHIIMTAEGFSYVFKDVESVGDETRDILYQTTISGTGLTTDEICCNGKTVVQGDLNLSGILNASEEARFSKNVTIGNNAYVGSYDIVVDETTHEISYPTSGRLQVFNDAIFGFSDGSAFSGGNVQIFGDLDVFGNLWLSRLPQNFQCGSDRTEYGDEIGICSVTFSHSFSERPHIVASVSSYSNSSTPIIAEILNITFQTIENKQIYTGFTVRTRNAQTGALVESNFEWIAIGVPTLNQEA